MGGTYQSKRIPVRGPPSVRRYQCFDRYRGIPIGTASDFDHYRGIPVGTPWCGRMVFSTELQVPYIVTYCLDFGPSGSVKTQISSG
ncbi:hypothetical protein BHE74_00052692 [Ensete ventricosum]|nr:hypothetical protein BHE74_00052692 [Ensete ventricosum]